MELQSRAASPEYVFTLICLKAHHVMLNAVGTMN